MGALAGSKVPAVRGLVVVLIAVAVATAHPAVSRAQMLGCPGDCNLDATVTVDELVVAAAIARGETSGDQCVSADANRDGHVRIEDLIRAVRRAMKGCPPMGLCGAFFCESPLPIQPDTAPNVSAEINGGDEPIEGNSFGSGGTTHSFCCYYSSVTQQPGRIFWCSERDPDSGACKPGACDDACDGCRSIQRGGSRAAPEIVCDGD